MDIRWRDSTRINPSSCRRHHIGGQIITSPRLSLVARGETSFLIKPQPERKTHMTLREFDKLTEIITPIITVIVLGMAWYCKKY